MDVEIIKMSSKGQVVIPLHLRNMLNAKEGTVFAVTGSSDTVMLKKVVLPSKKELIGQLKRISAESEAILRKSGKSEKDIIEAAMRARRR